MPLSLFHFDPMAFVLVVFRLAGMMLFAPLFGSARVPRRVKALLVLVLAYGMMSAVERHPVNVPGDTWSLSVAIGAELAFGLAMGMVLSLVFIAAQWAGELIGQQMGLNLSAVFDPQFGGQGSVLGDMYFMLTLVVFLAVGGHQAMLLGVHDSFEKLPLMSVTVDRPLFDTLAGLLQGATMLAIRLAAPMLLIGLLVGIVVSLLQAITQIQEQTLTFVPKIAAMVAAAILLMPWIGQRLIEYSRAMFLGGQLP
jgi:flagellar biosynthetic protein FliR